MTHQPVQPKPTESEKEILKEYTVRLKDRGFCMLDSPASNQTQVFNRFTGSPLPLSFIENDFDKWLHNTGNECEYRSARYITRTLPHVIGTKFVPTPEPYYTCPLSECTWVNTYRPYKPGSEDSDVSPLLLEFFSRLAPSEGERHTFLQWLAHVFQRPEQRPSWHVMLPSEPGTGKGYLVEHVLQPILNHTSVVASYSRVLGKHSTLLEDNLLVLLDDCKAKTDATQTELKSLLTEERQYVERKNLQGGMVKCYTRFILASNETRPLYLDPDERRWFVLSRLEHRESLQETQAFIAELDAWLNIPGSLCKVFNFFKKYSLEGFNPKAVPMSDGLQRVIELSKNPHELFFLEYIAEHKVFSRDELVQAYISEGYKRPSDGHIKLMVENAKLVKTRPYFSDGKQQGNLYHPPGMTDSEIESIRTATSRAMVGCF